MIRLLHFFLFLPEQGSTFARRADRLHYFIILTTFAAAIAIGATGLYFLVRYRARAPNEATEKVVAGLKLEAAFILVPLAFFLLWFFLGFKDYVWMKTPPPNAMTVYVTGKQWMWKFTYPDGPSGLDTLRAPLGRPVRLLVTSRDVVHSFFVPGFRLKQDAVPGRYTEVWFEATRVGHQDVLCAEYCGLNHSMMRADVEVMPAPDFDRWLEEQRRGHPEREDMRLSRDGPADDLRSQGVRVAERQGCFRCHTVDGTPHIGPTWLDLYGRTERLTDGSTVVADEAYLTRSMMLPAAQVVAGFNPVMPSYQGLLTPADTAALVELIKSLRSSRLTPTPSERPAYVPAR